MRVIGIDPSLTGTGVAYVDTVERTAMLQTIITKSLGDQSVRARLDRIEKISKQIFSGAHVDLVVIEAPALNSRLGKQHDRSGLWWSIVTWAIRNEAPVPVVEVSPMARSKYASGKGNASKSTVMAAVIKRYLDLTIADDNQADALALASIGCRLLGEPFEDSMPKVNLDALDKIIVPDLGGLVDRVPA